jgi:hypothetical protein
MAMLLHWRILQRIGLALFGFTNRNCFSTRGSLSHAEAKQPAYSTHAISSHIQMLRAARKGTKIAEAKIHEQWKFAPPHTYSTYIKP